MQGQFERRRVDSIVLLAAQASVPHSLTQPDAYVDSNVAGMMTGLGERVGEREQPNAVRLRLNPMVESDTSACERSRTYQTSTERGHRRQLLAHRDLATRRNPVHRPPHA
jgi:hypothetical protein